MKNKQQAGGGPLTVLLDGGTGSYASKLQELKHIAMNYHTSEEYRKIIDFAINTAQRLKYSPEDLRSFRELYIDRSMTIRRFSEQHHMSVRTVYKRANAVFKILMPIVYGVDGILFEE
jgi:hypothetical protein